MSLEAQLARKRHNAKVARAGRKRGQYRRMLTIPGAQFRRLEIMAQAEAGGALSHLNHEIVASLDDFQDPSQEWRRLFSELFGTFFLVLVAAGGGMMGQAFPGTISRAAAVVAPGLMVMAIILFMGKVSGAHLNPAVSIAFSDRKSVV